MITMTALGIIGIALAVRFAISCWRAAAQWDEAHRHPTGGIWPGRSQGQGRE